MKHREKVTVKVILDSDSEDGGDKDTYNIDELNKTYSKVIIAKASRINNPGNYTAKDSSYEMTSKMMKFKK